MNRQPDAARFFVAGVPKAGTTALCEFLGRHPQVYMCPIKEPGFFAAQELGSVAVQWMRKSVAEKSLAVEQWLAEPGRELPAEGLALEWRSYEALFDGVKNEIALGEGSMAYWWAAGAPRAIHDRYPGARFILLLRNPAERFFSQYLATRWSHPHRSCRDCFNMALEGRDEWGLVLDIGLYATHLRRFFGHFPQSQFSIHLYEDFVSAPAAVCREIFAFLGVDPDFPVDVSARVNEPLLPRAPMLQALRLKLPVSRSLSGLVPAPLRDLLRRTLRKPRSSEAMDPADRRAINDYYRDEILETSGLIGRDLSAWLQ